MRSPGDAETPRLLLELRAADLQDEVSAEGAASDFPGSEHSLLHAHVLLSDGAHLQAPQRPRSEPETGTPEVFCLSPGLEVEPGMSSGQTGQAQTGSAIKDKDLGLSASV